MKNRKVMLGIIVLTAICGCRSVGTHESILKEQISGLDKLGNVMVITREDGSGTRSTFSQLTGFDEKNKDHNMSIRCANDTLKYTNRSIVNRNEELIDKWKVFSSKMNGAAGTLMDSKRVSIIGKAYIGAPNSICSGALITFGSFDNEVEALNLQKYMATKFLRVMVGVMKSSRAIYQPVYKFVPLQDFTNNSDIDWNKSIHEIDLQLYKKYNLTDDEINYIESKIKEME